MTSPTRPVDLARLRLSLRGLHCAQTRGQCSGVGYDCPCSPCRVYRALPALLDLADAVVYAVRGGCFFDEVQEPQPSAGSAALIRWGAMRNLHEKIAALTTEPPPRVPERR